MKRSKFFLSFTLVALLVLCLCILPTHADAADVSDLTFELNSDGKSYAVTDCKESASGELTIPSTYNGYPVTIIGEWAFSYCFDLTSVIIPNGVTTIDGHAFFDCTSLTSVTIPHSVTSIDGYAFGSCTSLTSATIPDGVTTIGSSTFSTCRSLTSVNIPDSVTSIGSYAFNYCESLVAVNIGSGVTSIGIFAFSSCTSLTSITIPDNVTTIGYCAFSRCSSLISVTIPYSVTTIGNSAFVQCDSLVGIWVNDDNPNYCCDTAGVLFDKSKSTLIQAPEKITGSYIIPNSVTTIGEWAFFSCNSLTSVTIPDSVTTIGQCAFSDCTSLNSVTIPNSVTTIDNSVFSECTSLTSVTIPYSVTIIKYGAFKSCSSLTDVYYGGSEEQWASISIDLENRPLRYAEIHYNHLLRSWVQEDGKWFYYENGVRVVGWLELDGVWYYIQAKSGRVTGWLQYGPVWYYFNTDGVMRTGWLQYGGQHYYFDTAVTNYGRMVVNKWIQDGGNWYYFDANGYRVTGEYTINGEANIFDENGVWLGVKVDEQEGWTLENGGWFYYDGDTKVIGWLELDGTWYYIQAKSGRVTGWLSYGPVWYYFNTDGVMRTGWLKYGGQNYYFDKATTNYGRMAVNKWVQDGGKWYYLNENGFMVTGQHTIGGHKYRFNDDGTMYTGWYSEITMVNAAWPQAYMDKITELHTNYGYFDDAYYGEQLFKLIYLDNNDIPEVWAYTGDGAGGSILLTYAGGKVHAHQFSGYGDIAFKEKSGVFLVGSGKMGYYEDAIYELSNGKVSCIAYGSYDNGDDWEADFKYYWNGTRVSENTYFSNIKSYGCGNAQFPDLTYSKLQNKLATLEYEEQTVWYYYKPTGEMVTGKYTIGGKTYSFDANGVCLNP